MPKMHGLASGHKRSHNNPGEADASLPDDGYAYRTAMCGQVRYSKSDGAGGWRNQFEHLQAVDADDVRVTCVTCQSLARAYGIIE